MKLAAEQGQSACKLQRGGDGGGELDGLFSPSACSPFSPGSKQYEQIRAEQRAARIHTRSSYVLPYPAMEDAYLKSTTEVLSSFGVLDVKSGLSTRQVQDSRSKHGRNGA